MSRSLVSGIKRKAQAELNGQRNQKRTSSDTSDPTIRVRYLGCSNASKPIIASSPGISIPPRLGFKPYERKNEDGSELLLHSSSHPTIDFTAREDGTSVDRHLKHYVAIYDRISGQLDVTEAKNMTIRGTVRQRTGTAEDEGAPTQPTSNYSSRSALTHAFGTKKSKKLVQSRAENVLYSGEAAANVANPLSEAILSSLPEADAPLTTSDGRMLDKAAVIQAAKPLPSPDLTTTDVTQAYPLANLVFPSPFGSTLAAMPISNWRELIAEEKPVLTTARFVANRVRNITQSANAHLSPDSPQTTTLQMLRYILLLVELARFIGKVRPEKGIPPISKWPPGRLSDHSELPLDLLEDLIKKYCSNTTGPTKSDLILLHTTILALTLHIPPPSGNHGPAMLVTDPTDIQQDLNLTPADARMYFRELGCKVGPATDQELEMWGIEKPSGQPVKTKYARLRLPLVFPQVSKGPPSGRRQAHG